MLGQLQDARLVAPLDASLREGAYQLARPPDRIRVVDVLAALRGGRVRAADASELGRAVTVLLEEISEAEAKAAEDHSLADVLEGAAPAPARPDPGRAGP